jgi:hypothetical protein
MPSHNWDDDWEVPEPDEADEDGAELVPCPACGEPIYEEAQQCPSCGEYVTGSTSALAGRPWWFMAIGVAGVVAVIVYFRLFRGICG